MKRIVAAILHRPMGSTPLEQLVDVGRRSSAEDLIRRLSPFVREVVVATEAGEAAQAFHALGVPVREARTNRAFHFGRILKEIIRQHRADAVLYFGSGSGVLLEEGDIEGLCAFADRRQAGALLNNFFSCDFAVISDAPALMDHPLPATDNSLGFALSDAGIPCFALPRSLATQFDIDTPTDLALLKTAERGGDTLRRYLSRWSFEHPHLPAILARLVDRSALVYLIGRVHPGTWAAFERNVACRTGGVIEGRGMKASSSHRLTLLQRGLEEDGPTTFFDRLAAAADGALIDTRPTLAAKGGFPAAPDRFASDLFRSEQIEDPCWRAFTEAAVESPIPLILGGHNLVSGGLFLLGDACWKGGTLPRRLHPKPFNPGEEEA